MSLIKQKQVANLTGDLAAKANDSQVLKINNNLSDITDLAQARSNLSVPSSSEVNNLISGAQQAQSVSTIDARNALTGLKVTDRVFVSDDGDSKWALYLVVAVTDGKGSTSTFEKIADKDVFDNAMTSSAVKSAYESNSNTNAFTDSEKSKLGNISVSGAVNLESMQNEISNKMDSFIQEEESFTEMLVEPGMDNELNLSYPIKANHRVTVFFEGIKVDDIMYEAGENRVIINVPYMTEADDIITVQYAR